MLENRTLFREQRRRGPEHPQVPHGLQPRADRSAGEGVCARKLRLEAAPLRAGRPAQLAREHHQSEPTVGYSRTPARQLLRLELRFQWGSFLQDHVCVFNFHIRI